MAEEDRRRALAQNAVRVHIVVPGAESSIALREMGNELETEELDEERPSGEMAPPSDRGVPKVRHEGSWHTLH